MRAHTLVALAGALGANCASLSALAQTESTEGPPSPSPPSTPSALPPVAPSQPIAPAPAASDQPTTPNGIVLDGWFGGAGSSIVDGGSDGQVATGFTALYHGQWLELGADFTLQTDFGADTSLIAAGLVGVKVDPYPRLRLELLAEGGVDNVSCAGGLFTTVVSGGNATLPYLGGRAGMSLLLGHTRRIVLGWWMMAGNAIGPVTVNSVLYSCFLGCSTYQQTDTVGGWTVSGGLRIGGEIAQW
jgi:hypothetical protein